MPEIKAKRKTIRKGVTIADDVSIECDTLFLDEGVRIGVVTLANFRSNGGVRIKVKNLTVGKFSLIGRNVLIQGGDIRFGNHLTVREGTTINVTGKLQVGPHGTIHENCEICGRDINIGRHLWMLSQAIIGGGSCFDIHSKLRVGDYWHVGRGSFINTARPVTIGNEVGLGTETCLYTHGAYQSALRGFPVKFAPIHIGNNCWLPSAIVNPGVAIGKNSVIGAGSVVTRDIPEGCLAAGVPAKIIKENCYPQTLSQADIDEFMAEFLKIFGQILNEKHRTRFSKTKNGVRLSINGNICIHYVYALTKFSGDEKRNIYLFIKPNKERTPLKKLLLSKTTLVNLESLKITGFADNSSDQLLNQLRRYGVRFRFENSAGVYCAW